VFRSLASQLISIIIALILAATVWVVAISEENPSREAFYPNRLSIEVINLSAGLVVYGDQPDSALIRVRAPEPSWNQFHPGSFRVVADLQGLGAGEHNIKLQVLSNDSQAVVTNIDPESVKIRLERVKSRQMDVHSDVLDAAPLGYAFRSPVISPTLVTVTGAEALVDQVNEVVADVYLRGSKSPIEREMTVLARDALGNLVQGVTITPATVTVKVQVEQRVGYKDVSIKTTLKGAPAPGYWVSNITVNPSSATIVGSPDAMAKIAGFVETVPIDITGATADVSRRAVLSLPEGVSILNNEGITVQVSVTPLLGGQTVRRKVTLQGLARGLNASISPDAIDVILSGPVPNLQSLAPENAQPVVDATGLTPGTYVVKPRVTLLPDLLKVQSIVPDAVQVTVVGITPTPTPTLTPTLTVTATQTLTPTLAQTPTPNP
jgi:YbbR domain-containing protein